MIVLATLLAGAVGAVIRFFAARAGSRGILVVNVVGSFVAGLAMEATTGDVRLIVLTGFCGGLTTFSTFSVETVQYAMKGWWRMLAANILGNLVLGIGAATFGFAITHF